MGPGDEPHSSFRHPRSTEPLISVTRAGAIRAGSLCAGWNGPVSVSPTPQSPSPVSPVGRGRRVLPRPRWELGGAGAFVCGGPVAVPAAGSARL